MIGRNQVFGGLVGALLTRGHELVATKRGRCAIDTLECSDLVLVGFGTPGRDAVELCRRIRQQSSIPIVVVARADVEVDNAAVLDAGSDDCIGSGQELRESVARVEAVLRRADRSTAGGGRRRSPAVSLDGLRIDPQARTVRVRGELVTVTRKEFDLLYYLASRPGTVLSRHHLMREVWRAKVADGLGPDSGRTVDTHVSLLRSKLGDRRWIETVRGVGFRFRGGSGYAEPASKSGRGDAQGARRESR